MIKRHIALIKLVCYFIIMPVVVWNLTIGKSIGLWKRCEQSKKELGDLKNHKNTDIPEMPEITADGYLLDSIAGYKNIDIVKYSQFITASVEDYSLVANVLVISGNYFKIMEAVNRLENAWPVNSLSFQTEMNYKNRRKSLSATVITQEILKRDGL